MRWCFLDRCVGVWWFGFLRLLLMRIVFVFLLVSFLGAIWTGMVSEWCGAAWEAVRGCLCFQFICVFWWFAFVLFRLLFVRRVFAFLLFLAIWAVIVSEWCGTTWKAVRGCLCLRWIFVFWWYVLPLLPLRYPFVVFIRLVSPLLFPLGVGFVFDFFPLVLAPFRVLCFLLLSVSFCVPVPCVCARNPPS